MKTFMKSQSRKNNKYPLNLMFFVLWKQMAEAFSLSCFSDNISNFITLSVSQNVQSLIYCGSLIFSYNLNGNENVSLSCK